jgi:hypothetical protein
MTEDEWVTSIDPQTMLWLVRGQVSERKLRLFAVACCRLVWHLLVDERSRRAVEVAERFADGGATQQELEAARSDAWQFTLYEVWEEEAPDLGADALNAADAPAWAAEWSPEAIRAVVAVQRSLGPTGAAAQADLLRCIFGNPLRFFTLDAPPSHVARQLAQVAYDDRRLPDGTLDLGRLAVLADALEDGGCDDPQILGHLRGPGPHSRGCFAVDAVLGRS